MKIDNLKPEQKGFFNAVWIGKDDVAVLPIGHGKSLPYQRLGVGF